jgi:hypothetical protein
LIQGCRPELYYTAPGGADAVFGFKLAPSAVKD